MVKGRPKGSNTNSLLRAPQLSVWAQCDNQNCQKWRRLPPGSVVDDSVPWFVLIITASIVRHLTTSMVITPRPANGYALCWDPFLIDELHSPDPSLFPVGSVT